MSNDTNLGINPKDALGVKKPSLSKIPPIALLHESLAMMDGAGKYMPFNWRDKKIAISVYIDAMKRHLQAFESGEDYAEDSNCHHLGHLRACAGILLDAIETGNAVDDRHKNVEAYNKVFKEVMDKMPELARRHAEFHANKKK